MKKLIVLICLILTALSLYAGAIREDYRKAEEKALVSYAFGLVIGANMFSDLEIEIDYQAFADGVKAAIGDAQAQLSEQEAYEIIETAIQDVMGRRNEELRLQEEEFFARNRQRDGVRETASGLQYEIIEETGGEKPAADSLVKVYYTGSFIDGNVFDESGEEEGAYIPLDMVIPGWAEGVLLMGVGSKYRFYIPSRMAYGASGFQSFIPPYSALIFEVELLEIVVEEEEE